MSDHETRETGMTISKGTLSEVVEALRAAGYFVRPPSAGADPPHEPNRFRCNDDCGIVAVTEDGCCRTCGADTTPVYVPPLRELIEEIRGDPPPAPGSETPDTCSGCGGPYRFDTSLPSVLWNRVIRAQELPEKLCTTCIIQHFVRAGVSFTAELFGDGFKGEQFLVQVAGAESKTVALLNDENNRLRTELREAQQRLVTLDKENAQLKRNAQADDIAFSSANSLATDAIMRADAAETAVTALSVALQTCRDRRLSPSPTPEEPTS